jgi:hypothetical protein
MQIYVERVSSHTHHVCLQAIARSSLMAVEPYLATRSASALKQLTSLTNFDTSSRNTNISKQVRSRSGLHGPCTAPAPAWVCSP